MPTYEYLCQTCSHRFEQWQKMTDDPLTVCPECGGHIRRVFYPAGIVFKGHGFYKTDHASSSAPEANGHNGHNEHDAKGDSAATDTKTSSESKPSESGKSEKSGSSTGENKAPATTPAQ